MLKEEQKGYGWCAPVTIAASSLATSRWNPDCDVPPSTGGPFNPSCRCVQLRIPLIKGVEVLEIEYFVYGFVRTNRNKWYKVPANWDLEWAMFEAAPSMTIEEPNNTVVVATFKNWSANVDRQAYIGAVYKKP